MASTVETLLEASGLAPEGVVSWGSTVPDEGPGVYFVSLSEDPATTAGVLAAAPINPQAVAELLRVRPELTVDSSTGTAEQLAVRVGEFWLPDENILYIGLARTSIAQRIKAYYSTKLGHRSPHAGGWFLKLLDNLTDLHIHYAQALNPVEAEDRMLAAFVAAVSTETRRSLRDSDHPFPFANLEWPRGVRKAHGIRGATASLRERTPRVRMRTSGATEQNYPRPASAATDVAAINHFLQQQLRLRDRTEVAAVEAARWLDAAGLLADAKIRPGLPLRDLLRAGLITGQRQQPNRRWFIDSV